MGMNAVINTATGDVLRKGFVDFANSSGFDSGKETMLQDVPETIIIKQTNDNDFDQWNGTSFIVVARGVSPSKPRGKIMKEILENSEPVTQLPRMLAGLDLNASILAALDNDNYLLTSSRLQKALDAGDIIAADKTLVEDTFPAGWDS